MLKLLPKHHQELPFKLSLSLNGLNPIYDYLIKFANKGRTW